MSSNQKFMCALNNSHAVKEPVLLPKCLHPVCRECLLKEQNAQTCCELCGANADLRASEVTKNSSKKLETDNDIEKLFEHLENQAKEELKNLSQSIEDKKEIIDAQVKFIEEEIEVRIESIKIQLDEKFKDFQSFLRDYKDKLAQELNEENNQALTQLKKELQNKTDRNVKNLYEYQEKLEKLREEIANFEKKKFLLLFKEPSDFKIENKQIGEIYRSTEVYTESGSYTLFGTEHSYYDFSIELSEINKIDVYFDQVVNAFIFHRSDGTFVEFGYSNDEYYNKQTINLHGKKIVGFKIRSDKTFHAIQFGLFDTKSNLVEWSTFMGGIGGDFNVINTEDMVEDALSVDFTCISGAFNYEIMVIDSLIINYEYTKNWKLIF